jgi:hypothetical protein
VRTAADVKRPRRRVSYGRHPLPPEVVAKPLGIRPQWSNEAELMYEASRVARGLALYTDPTR